MCVFMCVRIYPAIIQLEIYKVNLKRLRNSSPEQYLTKYLINNKIDLIYKA